MSGPRRTALILGLLTLIYSMLHWSPGSDSAPLTAAALVSAVVLILGALPRPRTQRGRFAVVLALLAYSVCQQGILVVTYNHGARWSDPLETILLLIAGLAALVWSYRRAKRRKLSPMQAYFRN